MDRYAVIGNPISHSLSPRIHHLFAKQTGQTLTYEAILAPLDGFTQTVAQFCSSGGKGLNITLPFKLEACKYVDTCSPRAALAGAVNTIHFREDGSVFGDNTDGIGLLRDLTQNHGVAIKAQKILILGAGGAVRGVLEPLLGAEPARLVIANRTVSRAQQLRDDFKNQGYTEACGFNELLGQQFDLIINATSAGVSGQIPPLPENILRQGGSCYDMFYAKKPTPFELWSRHHGAVKSLNGIGMLVEQAAESFYIWRGVRPQTQEVIKTLISANNSPLNFRDGDS